MTKQDFDERHGARSLKTLLPEDKVWLSDEETAAKIQAEAKEIIQCQHPVL